MRRFKFAIAVAVTSLALIAIIGAVLVFTTPIGALAAQGALGNPPWMGGVALGLHGFGGQGFNLPPEIKGLGDIPPADRFAHFVGVQVNLKDKDNKPLTITVTPGTATAASSTSLAMTANDGSIKTFALSSATIMHGKTARSVSQAAQQAPAKGDKVVVITSNNDQTAMAVIDIGSGDFGPGGFSGPPWAHWGNHSPQH